jgi:hypothetical protein
MRIALAVSASDRRPWPMNRTSLVLFSAVALVGLRAESCGSTPARTYCQGEIIRIELEPNHCAPIAKCHLDPTASGSDRYYGADYRLVVTSLRRTDPGREVFSGSPTASDPLPSWLVLGLRNPPGVMEATDTPLESARVCATEEVIGDLAAAPDGAIEYALFMHADRATPLEGDPNVGDFEVHVRVAKDLANDTHYEVETQLAEQNGTERSAMFGWLAFPDSAQLATAALIDGDPTGVEYRWSLLPEAEETPIATGEGRTFEFAVPRTCDREILNVIEPDPVSCGRNVLVQADAIRGGTVLASHQAQVSITSGPLAVFTWHRDGEELVLDASGSFSDVRAGKTDGIVEWRWRVHRLWYREDPTPWDVDNSLHWQSIRVPAVSGDHAVSLIVLDSYGAVHETRSVINVR